VDKQKTLTSAEAGKVALELWERQWVIPRYHAQSRFSERRVKDSDVVYVLETGLIYNNPVWDEEFQNWEYTICGKDLDGENLAVVFAFDELFKELIIITVKDW